MQEYYKALGLNENATDEQVDKAYSALKAKYSKDRFLEGEEGNDAARKLTFLEVAYKEIKESRAGSFDSNGTSSFEEVEKLLREGNINGAQEKLDKIPSNYSAEWHYLQSVIFYKKNWYGESRKQLEIAINMDPNNSKYTTAYNKLKAKMDSNQKAFQSNYSQGYAGNQQTNGQQMGGTNDCLTFCATWCCMDMLCSICCQ